MMDDQMLLDMGVDPDEEPEPLTDTEAFEAEIDGLNYMLRQLDDERRDIALVLKDILDSYDQCEEWADLGVHMRNNINRYRAALAKVPGLQPAVEQEVIEW